MALYIARKGNEQFYVQPRMVEAYSLAGYEILKTQEVVVQDIAREVEKISETGEIENE